MIFGLCIVISFLKIFFLNFCCEEVFIYFVSQIFVFILGIRSYGFMGFVCFLFDNGCYCLQIRCY